MSLESKLLHPRYHPEYHPGISAQPMIPESARAEFWPTTSPRRVGLASCARRGAEGSFLCSLSSRFSGGEGGVGSLRLCLWDLFARSRRSICPGLLDSSCCSISGRTAN